MSVCLPITLFYMDGWQMADGHMADLQMDGTTKGPTTGLTDGETYYRSYSCALVIG